jgi:hypothetical protein
LCSAAQNDSAVFLLLCIGALLATGAIALARDLVALSLGAIFSFCVIWVPFASLLYIAGLQDWRKPTQQELETRARKKRAADAQWAKWRASRPNADEPEHWIFKRASEPNPYDEPNTAKRR